MQTSPSPKRDLDADVAIVGAGPAGCAAAILLAGWGHRVVVLAGRSGPLNFGESLPPSSRKQLGILGVLPHLTGDGIQANEGNAVRWAGEEARVESFGGESGFHLERHQLHGILRQVALDAGARLIRGTARDYLPLPDGRARVSWTDRAESGTVRARWLLDCSGRSGFLSRLGGRVGSDAVSTMALIGLWSRPGGFPGVAAGHTCIESYAGGWIWSVPVSPARRYVAAMVDPGVTPLERRGTLSRIYRAELASAPGIRAMLRGAAMEGRPGACVATPYRSTHFAHSGVLLAGDAGSFLDPLSSHGVRKALASGWLAAVTVNTVLSDPDMEGPALQLFGDRQAVAAGRYRDLAERHYADGAEHYGTPFWTRRAGTVVPEAGAPDGDVAALQGLAMLRASDHLRLRPAGDLRYEARPTVRGNRVVLEPHLRGGSAAEAVRYVEGVDLPLLVNLAPAHRQVPELYEAYSRAATPVQLPDFLRALSTLLGWGVLVSASDP